MKSLPDVVEKIKAILLSDEVQAGISTATAVASAAGPVGGNSYNNRNSVK